MSYQMNGLAYYVNLYLTTLQNKNPAFDISIDSDHYVRACAIASVAEGLEQRILWAVRQIFADTADDDNMAHQAALKGLTAKPATHALGTGVVTGSIGAVIAAGTTLQLESGALVVLRGGSVVLDVSPKTIDLMAVDAGLTGNVTAVAGAWQQSISGVDADVSNITLADGADAETPAELLARLLDVLREPPAGGKLTDYKRWCLEVPGVNSVFGYKRLRGLGTVDLFITTDTGVPSQALLETTYQYLWTMSPAGIKDVAVRAPAEKFVNVHIKVDGAADFETALKPRVMALIEGYFKTFEPGEKLVLSKLQSLVASAAGVSDVQIITPTVNVLAAVNGNALEWLRLGTLTVEAMV